jgi:hypothetical protein
MSDAVGHADLMPEPGAQSPFFASTALQWAWDSTSLALLKECPRKYHYVMIEGWRAKGESVHLRFGGLYHSALEGYDKLRAEGAGHDEALEEVIYNTLVDTWDRPTCPECKQQAGGTWFCANCGAPGNFDGKPWDSGHNLKNRHTLIRTIVWYLEAFRDDAAKTVILADGKPAVELSFRMELDEWPAHNDGWRWLQEDHPYTLCGHLDRLVEFAGGYYVMDRKTTGSTLGGYYFDGFNPDNQMTLYTLAGRIIFNTPVRGVIIDAAQIAVGFSRFDRGITYRTEDQLNEWMKDLSYWFSTAARYAERRLLADERQSLQQLRRLPVPENLLEGPAGAGVVFGKRLRAPRVESAGGAVNGRDDNNITRCY